MRIFEISRIVAVSGIVELRHLFMRYRRGPRERIWDIDVVYLNGWVAVFQFLIGLPLLYPSALASGLPMADLVPNIIDGFWCFMGKCTEVDLGYSDDIKEAIVVPLPARLYHITRSFFLPPSFLLTT